MERNLDRLTLVAGFLVVLVSVIGFGVLCLSRPVHRINKGSFDKIEEGMTEVEIERIMGCGAGWYAGVDKRPFGVRSLKASLFSKAGAVNDNGHVSKGWASEDFVIVVTFDLSGKVTSSWFTTNETLGTWWPGFGVWPK